MRNTFHRCGRSAIIKQYSNGRYTMEVSSTFRAAKRVRSDEIRNP